MQSRDEVYPNVERKEGKKGGKEEDSDICLFSVYMDKRGGDDEE